MKPINCLLATMCAVLIAGCGTRLMLEEGSHAPIRVDTPDTTIRWDSASLLDDAIARKIAVENITAGRSPTGTLQVVTILRNRTDFEQQVEARTTFYDADGVPLESASGWQRIVLGPNAFENYECLSMSIGAGHYHVEIREGR
jgi:hypothetical protein